MSLLEILDRNTSNTVKVGDDVMVKCSVCGSKECVSSVWKQSSWKGEVLIEAQMCMKCQYQEFGPASRFSPLGIRIL